MHRRLHPSPAWLGWRHLPTVSAVSVVLLRLIGLARPLRADEAGFLLVARTWEPGPHSLYGSYWVDRPPALVALVGAADALAGPMTLRVVGAVGCGVAVLLAASALAFYLSRSDGEGGRMLDPRAVEILASAPAAIPLVADAATEAYGTLFVAPDATEALLVVDDLPASEPDTVYQVWLVRDGERTSGGTFTVNGGHDAAMIVSAPQPIAAFQALGITIEPAPDGSPGPTGPRVVSCSLEELPT